jgi:hypothetical protein
MFALLFTDRDYKDLNLKAERGRIELASAIRRFSQVPVHVFASLLSDPVKWSFESFILRLQGRRSIKTHRMQYNSS